MIKKLILLGFGLTLLIGLPLTIFVLQNQNQTTTTSGAAPVTKFSFAGTTSVNPGQNFDENLTVDPGASNQVSFVKFTFTYDSNFLTVQSPSVTVDTTKYTVLDGPTSSCNANVCTISETLSIGTNQNAVIKTATPIAVVHFTATNATDANGTQLAFVSGQNQALSVASSDQAAENVFQTGVPATIIIGGSGGGGGTDTPTPTPTGTDNGGGGGNGGGGSGGGGGGGSGGGGSGGGGGLSVSCTSFTPDKTSGTAPLIVTFTTVGASTNDSISQLNITYGDGTTDVVATGSGIGTGDINNQISHTYTANGTFTATAQLTTAGGATSNSSTCTQTISVGNIAANGTSPTPLASLPPTGPGENILLIGAAGLLMSLVGLGVVAGF